MESYNIGLIDVSADKFNIYQMINGESIDEPYLQVTASVVIVNKPLKRKNGLMSINMQMQYLKENGLPVAGRDPIQFIVTSDVTIKKQKYRHKDDRMLELYQLPHVPDMSTGAKIYQDLCYNINFDIHQWWDQTQEDQIELADMLNSKLSKLILSEIAKLN